MLLDRNPHYYWDDFSSDTIFYKNHFIIRSEKKNQWKNAIIELKKKLTCNLKPIFLPVFL